MRLTVEHVLDRVNRTEEKRRPYLEMADTWERMYKGDAGFGRSLSEAIKAGHEQVATPLPFNTVNLAQRLLTTDPKVDVAPIHPGEQESEEYAQSCEQFLESMWEYIAYTYRNNLIRNATHYILVRGRVVFQVLWIEEETQRKDGVSNFPIYIRTLDPKAVGVHFGPRRMEYAYHKYEISLMDALLTYPELRETAGNGTLRQKIDEMDTEDKHGEDATVCITDFWYLSEKDRSVWNCVLVDDEYAIEPNETGYPDIPIVVGRGDYAVGLGDEMDGLSILHPLSGLWEYQSRLLSQLATGLMWYYWPAIMVQNEMGQDVDDIEVGPGIENHVPAGTKVDIIQINPNVPLAEAVRGHVEELIQQSAFAEVLYGKSPGELQAGYGVSLLSDSAEGRIKNFLEGLEMAIAHVNMIVLACIEKWGGKKGVSIWVKNKRDDEMYTLTITGDMIQGNYQNRVEMKPRIPQNEIQKQTIGIRLADGKYISHQTLRDQFIGQAVPSDEAKRVALEEAMQSDEARPIRIRRAMMEYFGEDQALEYLAEMGMLPPPPEGMEWTQDGKLKKVETPPEMGGMPPEMSGPTGPSGPGGMPGGEMGMGAPGGMGAPPEQLGPLPPPPAGAEPIQAPGLAGPEGGGIPPELAAQLTPEDLNMIRDQDPILYQQLVSAGLAPGEELDMLSGPTLPEI